MASVLQVKPHVHAWGAERWRARQQRPRQRRDEARFARMNDHAIWRACRSKTGMTPLLLLLMLLLMLLDLMSICLMSTA